MSHFKFQRTPGVYNLGNGVTEKPFNYTTLIVYKRGATIHQIGLDADNNYMAYRVGENNVWKNWSRCDNFGCSTASDLASGRIML